MPKQFVNAAIDHGTTNSAIAIMEENGPMVIKPNGTDPIMPSAVYINKRGRILVGWAAYKAMLTEQPGEGTGYMRYKIRIGQDDRYIFEEANKIFTAPDLGGIVIGELLNAAYEEINQKIQACVITVPAKFEQSACEGTNLAAKKAGLLYAPLLQEPIAAALSYGFSTEIDHGNLLVFDLGGGTLDISLVLVRKGQMRIPENGHTGDNRLGGSKFDREIMDYVLNILSKKYSLSNFSGNNPLYKSAWGKLMLAIEEAKITLSEKEKTVIEIDGELCKDEKGAPVYVEIPLTRETYEKLIDADVSKTLQICQNLIKKNRLIPRDIDGIILVGGPTKTPYVQQMLLEELNINLFKNVDPMTAVAVGGAIYASTIEIPEIIRKQMSVSTLSESSDINIRLEYSKLSKLPKYTLVGKIETRKFKLNGLFVEIARKDGGWNSGRIPINDNGVFMAELILFNSKKPHLSQFVTSVKDNSGNILINVNEPEIWYPFPEGGIRLANSLRVALKNNQTQVLIKGGSELPTRGTGHFETTKTLRKGSKEDILKIPILETVNNLLGEEDDHADCNVHVGSIIIHGDDERVSYDVPAGSAIDLTIEMDESRNIKTIAYIPLLDEEFESTFVPEPFGIKLEDVKQRFNKEKNRLKEVEFLHSLYPLQEVGETLQRIERMQIVENIKKDLSRAENNEMDACYRGWTRVLELSATINSLNKQQQKIRIYHYLNKIKDGASESDLQRVSVLESELEGISQQNDQSRLQQIEKEVTDLDIRIRHRPYYVLSLHVACMFDVPVSKEAYEYLTQGVELLDELESKGAPDTLTQEDINRVVTIDKKIVSAIPDIDHHVQNFLKGLSTNVEPEEVYGTTIKKRSR